MNFACDQVLDARGTYIENVIYWSFWRSNVACLARTTEQMANKIKKILVSVNMLSIQVVTYVKKKTVLPQSGQKVPRIDGVSSYQLWSNL
jgi:hypothetical protein